VIRGKKVLSVIPARSGSKGIPGKNLRLLKGSPLVTYPIIAALESKYVDHVFCSTNSLAIAEVAAKAGADTSYLRPDCLAADETSSVDVLLDVIEYFESVDKFFDLIVMLEPTSPMTESEDLDAAIELFVASEGKFENLISVSESMAGHPQFTFRMTTEQTLQTYDGSDWRFKRRQDLEKIYFQTGSLYISQIEALKLNRSFISQKTLGFEVPKIKSFEIDDLIDFKIIEMLMLSEFQPKSNGSDE